MPLDSSSNGAPILEETLDARCSESLARKTTKYVFDSAARLLSDLDASDAEERLARAVSERTCSADFVKALANFCRYENDSRMELASRFSPVASGNLPQKHKLELNRDYYESLTSVVKRIKDKSTPEFESAVSKIERLSADSNIETRESGKVVVSAIFENGRSQRCVVKLKPEDYALACAAHAEGRFVQISGKFDRNEFNCLSFQQLDK